MKNYHRRFIAILFTVCLLFVAGCNRDEPAAEAVEPNPTSIPIAAAAVATLPPPAVATSTAEPSPPTETVATDVPPAVPTAEPPTAEPSPTPEPLPTALPTATSIPSPTPTPEAIYPEWLAYLNQFREMAGVEPLSEQAALTLGGRLHSEYMVVNDAAISHKQDPNNALYDPAGDQAARNGNVFSSSMVEGDYMWGINFWVSAPFHLVPMVAPRLETVGYGDYNAADGGVAMAAVLDVRTERNTGPETDMFPVFFPGDGSRTWVGRHNLFEWPDPLTSCPGYTRPTGSAILVQLGDGTLTPSVGGHAVLQGDTPVETCLFDESTYHNPDPWAEKTGRLILGSQDAVVIMPRHPLVAGETYTVQLDADGERHMWQFQAVASAEEAGN